MQLGDSHCVLAYEWNQANKCWIALVGRRRRGVAAVEDLPARDRSKTLALTGALPMYDMAI